MQPDNRKRMFLHVIPSGVVFLLLLVLGGYALFKLAELKRDVSNLSSSLASTTAVLVENTKVFSSGIAELKSQTSGLSNTLSNTQQNIDDVKNKVGGVEQAVGSISGTVGNLQKLADIDPMLLKKYSKVYFTNENYVPAHLMTIPQNYLYSTTRFEEFLTEGWPFLKDLLDSAKASGVDIFVESGYRSFAGQQTLKSSYRTVYGAGTANSFSADQGYSEHQLGTTVDFITTGLGGQLDGFEKTKAYEWLVANAHRFGFELSYPKGNDYYVFEPWHWRFVGVKIATLLHENKLSFYDVDQREIDKYLINIFDK